MGKLRIQDWMDESDEFVRTKRTKKQARKMKTNNFDELDDNKEPSYISKRKKKRR